MFEAIARWSLARPRLIAVACIWFVAWGAFYVRDMRFDFLPDLAPAEASIQTEAPGMVAEQVEQLVTRPIESGLIGAAGVGSVRSQSVQGLSFVTVRFTPGADPYRARQAVSESLAALAGALPAGVSPPRISPLVPAGGDAIQVGFTSKTLDPIALRKLDPAAVSDFEKLRDLVQWTVRPRLLAAAGVARVAVYGGGIRRIEVRARPADLSDSDLGFIDILNATKRATSVAGAGFIDTAGQRVLIEPRGQALTTDDVGAGQIPAAGAAPTRIADVADVVETAAPAFGDALIMGKPGVLVSISGQYGANTLATTEAVDHALAVLRPALAAEGIQVRTDLDWPAAFIEEALRGIAGDLMIGMALIVVALIVFLRDLRAVAISLIGILLSLLAAVVALKALGLTLNSMTLGGLAVGLGVVVDDGVIDVENILSDLREAEAQRASHRDAVLRAGLEVRGPVVYATLAVIVAVLPLLVLQGPQGALLAPLADGVIAASLASLVVAAVVTPSLCWLFLRGIRPTPDPGGLRILKAAHGAVLTRLSARPAWVLLGALAVTAVAVASVLTWRSELLPNVADAHLTVQLSAPAATSLETMDDYGARIASDLATLRGVRAISQRVGRDASGDESWGPERGVLDIALAPGLSAAEQARLADRVRARLRLYPGLAPAVASRFAANQQSAQSAAPFEVRIYGQDPDALQLAAGRIATVLKALPGARDVQSPPDAVVPVVRADLNFQRLALYSLSAADVLDTIQAAFAGERVAQIFEAGRVVDLAVSAQADLRQDPEKVGDLLLRSTSGIAVPLKAVANVYLTDGRAEITHDGGFPSLAVTASPVDAAGFENLARRAIAAKAPLPPGVFIEYGGAGRAAAKSRQDLLIDYAFAIFGIVALLAIAFDARTGGVILISTLFSFVGAAAAVALMGGVLSIGATVGFIALLGVSMRGAILVFDRLEELVLSGEADWSAQTVIAATRERLTPLLMTAILVALGLAPLALHAGEAGREILGPMAIVIIAGLLVGAPASLLILPPMILALWRPAYARRGREAGAPAAG